MQKTVVINHKRYTVTHVFNMVGNWHFTDKNGTAHLVDGEDVAIWADEQGMAWAGIDTAIAYARHYADAIDGGVFWWAVR